MSDQTLDVNETTEAANDELALLKQRARMLGVEFSNNIGIETLRERVRAKMESDSDPATKTAAPLVEPGTVVGTQPKTLREQLYDDNMKLVRLRITNLNPNKKELPGEIVTVANEYLGTIRKYIPYGEVTDEGYHVPYIIYEVLRSRKFLNIRTYKDRLNQNNIKIEQTWAQEFALEVLPPLTKDELAKLAAAQLAAGGLS